MSRSSHVLIVCSPRPRVGKTLVARLAAEFYRADARPVGAYDLSPHEPALIEFLPNYATRASIADIRGQMALFDRLVVDDDKPKVIDLGHLSFAEFFTIMYQIDFVAEARRRSVDPIVLFIADANPGTAQTYALLMERFPDFAFWPVRNDAVAHGVDMRKLYPTRSQGVPPLHIPLLSPSLRGLIDARPFSFTEFRREPPPRLPDVLREEMESWIKRIFLQLRELELQLIMSNLKHSLARPA